MNLPLGYPPEGTVTSARMSPVTKCQWSDCDEPVTVIILHTVNAANGEVYLFCHQLCEEHAAANTEAFREAYKMQPPRTVWRERRPDEPGG